MIPNPRPDSWEDLKNRLTKQLPLFGWLCARRIGQTNSHLRFGRIEPPNSCEINAVDHCNLACRDCNHASPVMSPNFADPARVHADLLLLAPCYKPLVICVIGGEPLLHPDLPELLRAIRRSGINGRLRLNTNGLLLDRMPARVWEQIDILEICSYPQTPLGPETLKMTRKMARQHQVEIVHWQIDEFRSNFALQGTPDQGLVQRIYRNCLIAHYWSCHSVHQGYFYKCPQAIYLPRLIGDPAAREEGCDGIRLTARPSLRDELAEYLASTEPLAACHYCLGGVGRQRPHRITGREVWREEHDRPTEALVDFEKLQQLEARFKPIGSLRRPVPESLSRID